MRLASAINDFVWKKLKVGDRIEVIANLDLLRGGFATVSNKLEEKDFLQKRIELTYDDGFKDRFFITNLDGFPQVRQVMEG